jgi:hypothetical protein
VIKKLKFNFHPLSWLTLTTMIKARPEFGNLNGQYFIVEGGWYGHKTAAATIHEHLADKLRKVGFVPTKADLDL